MLPVQQQPFGLRQQIPSREGSGGGPASWPETFTPISRLLPPPCRGSMGVKGIRRGHGPLRDLLLMVHPR